MGEIPQAEEYETDAYRVYEWLPTDRHIVRKYGKSEKTFDGAIHRIDKTYEKLRPLWEHSLKLKALKRFLVRKNTKKVG